MKFPDVNENAWYAGAVERVSTAGIMIGDEKGKFRPNDQLTRAEAATVICRLLDRFGWNTDD